MPEIRNPNLESQGSGGGSGGGDFRSLILFTFLGPRGPDGFPVFSSQAGSECAGNADTSRRSNRPRSRSALIGDFRVSRFESRERNCERWQPSVLRPRPKPRSRTRSLRIVFTNRGAQVKHWILKKYTDTTGKPLDMVQPQAAERFGLPLSLFTYDTALTAQLNRRSTRLPATGQRLAPNSLHASTTRQADSMSSRPSISIPAM